MKQFYFGNINDVAKGRENNEILVKEPSYLQVVDNHIYFYAEIGRHEALKLNKELKELSSGLLHDATIQNRKPADIFLHINSYGGEVFNGLSVLDNIDQLYVPVKTIIDGCCASASTLFSVGGSERLINKRGFVLIHEISSFMWGRYSDFQDEMKNLDLLMDTIRDVYKQYTKIPDNKLNEILHHNLWFDAKSCLEYGIVDRIL